MQLVAPKPWINDFALGVRATLLEGIDSDTTTLVRALHASGSADKARLAIDGRGQLDPVSMRMAIAGAQGASEAAIAWLDRISLDNRASNAVLEAARRRITSAATLVTDAARRSALPGPRAAEHLAAARDLIDGVALHSTGTTGADVVSLALQAAPGRHSDMVRATMLLGSASTLLDRGGVASVTARIAHVRTVDDLTPARMARATQALSDLASARDLLRNVSDVPDAPAIAADAAETIRGVLAEMADGLGTLRFPDAAERTASLTARAQLAAEAAATRASTAAS